MGDIYSLSMKFRVLQFILAGFLIFSTATIFTDILTGDEIDYYEAVQQGFYENYAGRGSISAFEFTKSALQKLLNGEENNLIQKMMQSRDTLAYRHFHGPVAFYPYMFFGTEDLLSFRYVSSAIALLFILLMLYLFPPGSNLVGLLAVFIITANLIYSEQILTIGPHLTYAVLSLLTFIVLKKFWEGSQPGSLYILAVISAIAISTLEYSLFLLGFCLLVLAIKRHSFSLKTLLKSATIFILTLILIWPAGILQGKLLMSYGVYFYAALFLKLYRDWSHSLLFQMPAHLVNIAFTVIVSAVFFFRKENRKSFNFLLFVYGISILIVNIPNHFVYSQYIFAFSYIFWPPAVAAISSIASRSHAWRNVMVLVLLIIAIINYTELESYLAYRKESALNQSANLGYIAEKIKGSENIGLIGYPNYVAASNLKSKARFFTLNPDLTSIKEAEQFLSENKIENILLFNSFERDLSKIPSENIKTWANDNLILVGKATNCLIYKNKFLQK